MWPRWPGPRELQIKGAARFTCPDIYSPFDEIYSPVEDNKGSGSGGLGLKGLGLQGRGLRATALARYR